MRAPSVATSARARKKRHGRRRIVSICLLALVLGLALPPRIYAEAARCNHKDPMNALWLLAENCKEKGCYSTCGRYNPADQYVIIKDFRWNKNRAYLIIPTKEMKGIESPEVIEEPFANFWQYGWEVAKECPGQAPAHTALAINSECARTEDQLHIHISCVRSEVRQCLAEKDQRGEISSQPAHPTAIALGPGCRPFEVIKVNSLKGKNSPFDVIRRFPGVNDGNMKEHSIAVVGSETPDSFYLLDTYHHGDNIGGAEELLNQDCSDWLQPHAAAAQSCQCQ
jgi:CDP-diacylglycerol pyrophosphatase